MLVEMTYWLYTVYYIKAQTLTFKPRECLHAIDRLPDGVGSGRTSRNGTCGAWLEEHPNTFAYLLTINHCKRYMNVVLSFHGLYN